MFSRVGHILCNLFGRVGNLLAGVFSVQSLYTRNLRASQGSADLMTRGWPLFYDCDQAKICPTDATISGINIHLEFPVAMTTNPASDFTMLQHLQFPGESAMYRTARNALLAEEMELRRHLERVASQRRALPRGGKLKEDYVFERSDARGQAATARMSELFAEGKNTLAIYSFMFGPERTRPCPGCTHFLDALNGSAQHIQQRINFWVIAKSPLQRLRDFAAERHWDHLQLLSTAGSSYDADYYGDSTKLAPKMREQQEFEDGKEWDMPMLNVFRREGDAIWHRWGSELLYVPPEPGQQYRHNDLLDPLWNMFDVVPEGRGEFEPKLQYP